MKSGTLFGHKREFDLPDALSAILTVKPPEGKKRSKPPCAECGKGEKNWVHLPKKNPADKTWHKYRAG